MFPCLFSACLNLFENIPVSPFSCLCLFNLYTSYFPTKAEHCINLRIQVSLHYTAIELVHWKFLTWLYDQPSLRLAHLLYPLEELWYFFTAAAVLCPSVLFVYVFQYQSFHICQGWWLSLTFPSDALFLLPVNKLQRFPPYSPMCRSS